MPENVNVTDAVIVAPKKEGAKGVLCFPTRNGGNIFKFTVTTPVSDRNPNMRLFRRCAYFTNSEDKTKQAQSKLMPGVVLNVSGFTSRTKKGKDSTEWEDVLEVTSFTVIEDAKSSSSDSDNVL